jgi:hypothetical protein
MRIEVKRLHLLTLSISIALVAATHNAFTDPFEAQGLYPAACIVSGADAETFDEVQRIIKDSGARALHVFPGRAVFGRFPRELSASDFPGLHVRIARTPREISPGDLDPLTRRIIHNMFNEEKFMLGKPPPDDAGPVKVGVLRIPVDESIPRRAPVRRMGTPSELQERYHNQNSEFMIGRVVANIIFPESEGDIENWTEEEIADAMSGISLAISQYQAHASWVELDFIYNYSSYIKIPVSVEPMQVGQGEDQFWMVEAFDSIGFAHGRHTTSAHYLNEYSRAKYGADWAFTAFVVDASDHGCIRPATPYVAYASFGGPLMLVPYPACSFGAGIGFAQVFAHTMGHIFWALDEHSESPLDCGLPSGYLSVRNYNVEGCETATGAVEIVDCIMRDEPFSEWPLDICPYTLGQIGLGDANGNSVPDIYEIPPQAAFTDTMDTLLETEHLVTAVAWNEAIPNVNPFIPPEELLHYAPRLAKGRYWLNDGLSSEIDPADGVWNESSEDIAFTVSDLIAGRNTIYLEVENFVGLPVLIQRDVFHVGLRFYQTEVDVQEGWIEIVWKTAEEVFGASFDVMRKDMTTGGDEHAIATVDSCRSSSSKYKYFACRDVSTEPGHEYRYRIVASFELEVDDSIRSFVFESPYLYRTAVIPVGSNLVSNLLPNPTTGRTSFTVDVPKSYHDPAGGGRVSMYPDSPAGPARIEIPTPVDISIFDVKGQKMTTVYSMKQYGGIMTHTWDGVGRRGRLLRPGVYFLRVEAGHKTQVKKLVILR